MFKRESIRKFIFFPSSYLFISILIIRRSTVQVAELTWDTLCDRNQPPLEKCSLNHNQEQMSSWLSGSKGKVSTLNSWDSNLQKISFISMGKMLKCLKQWKKFSNPLKIEWKRWKINWKERFAHKKYFSFPTFKRQNLTFQLSWLFTKRWENWESVTI